MGSKKTGINPDNVATPIAASFGDLITLAILAWISQGLYNCLGERRRVWTGYFQMEIRHKTSQHFFTLYIEFTILHFILPLFVFCFLLKKVNK